jgi:general secretion pathway protein C
MATQSLLQNAGLRFGALADTVRGLPVIVWRNLLIALALLWMVHNLARLFWAWIPSPELTQPPVIVTQAIQSGEKASTYKVDLASMQAQQIFGEPAEEAPVQEQVIETNVEDDVEKTRLNLKLVGLLASSDQKQAKATIANGSKQAIYQLNDTLPVGNNVKLAKVLSDRVILNNNGNYEALWLYSEADFNVIYSRTTSQRNDPEEDRDEESNNGVRRIESSVRPSQVPESISDVVRFSMHREEGQMVGFRIRPGKNRDLFDQLGLEANDVVTSVNGIAIDNAQAIRDNYQQLKSATQADLEIKRGEELVYVNVTLDTLSE